MMNAMVADLCAAQGKTGEGEMAQQYGKLGACVRACVPTCIHLYIYIYETSCVPTTYPDRPNKTEKQIKKAWQSD